MMTITTTLLCRLNVLTDKRTNNEIVKCEDFSFDFLLKGTLESSLDI